jgi:Polysaccharide deacetylase
MKTIVLTFHAVRRGLSYAENDHIAFDETLRELSALRIPIRPLHELVAALANPVARWRLPTRCVALTCDDGELGEVTPMPASDGELSPSFSELQGKYVSAQKACGGLPHLTSFVIASESARQQIRPNGDLTHDWWHDAARSGLVAIENHSWDHCHPDVAEIKQRTQTKGTFKGVDTYQDADWQIRHAAQLIDATIAPSKTSLFAYPFGDANEYLVHEYFPRFRHEHRMKAALTTEPAPVTKESNRWALPRYVCGHDWKTDDEFRAMLKDAHILR